MFGLYRVALSLLILLTAIAAKAETGNPILDVMGSGLGVPTPGLNGGLQDPGAGMQPGDMLAPSSNAREAFVKWCNSDCMDKRIQAASVAYSQRNNQTTASLGGASGAGQGAVGSGATANLSATGVSDTGASSGGGATGDVSINGSLPGQGFAPGRGVTADISSGGTGAAGGCDPQWSSMPASALIAIENNPSTTPDTLAMIRQCLGGGAGGSAGAGFGGPNAFIDQGQCVATCMAGVDKQFGPKPEERNNMDPQALMTILSMTQGQEQQDNRPPWETGVAGGESSSDSNGPGYGIAVSTSGDGLGPVPTAPPGTEEEDD